MTIILVQPSCASGASGNGHMFQHPQTLLLKPDNALLCSEMLVQWTTRDKGSPMAFWRARGESRLSNASASSDTYRREDLCGGVANSTGFINPGWFHTAKLRGLQPSTEYLYSYGDEVHPLS